MKKIILASRSVDRRELFEKIRIPVEIIITNVDEDEYKDQNLDPFELVMKLSEIKALKAKKKLMKRSDNAIVIAADTIIEYNGKIIGKATNKEHAFEILKTLNNSTHNLISGIAITQNNNDKILKDFDQTKVTFMKLSDDEIQKYIDTGEWEGRAGAYSIKDKASIFIKSINGSPSNVVGLPMHKIFNILKYEFNLNLFDL